MIQRTCGILISNPNAPPEFCGHPATFRYEGLIRIHGHEDVATALALRGQNITDLCMDHSREMFIRMEPALRGHQAVMRCLLFTRVTQQCTACRSLFRTELVPPLLHKEPARFCPNCGASFPNVTTTQDPELDYWEIIAETLDLPTGLTTQIHAHWMRDRTATSAFIDYVHQIQSELDD